jgi:hypothetical protein
LAGNGCAILALTIHHHADGLIKVNLAAARHVAAPTELPEFSFTVISVTLRTLCAS